MPPRTERRGMSTSEFERGLFDLEKSTEFKNILLYGDSGCGKTALAATLPGRVLYLAGEPGYQTAVSMGAKGKVSIIPDTATAVAALDWLESGNASKFDWIVPDGLGTMQTKFLLGYAAEAFDANPAKRAHRNLPDKPDYFNAQNFIKSWVARLIDLPCNVLFTAHAMRPEDEAGETLVYPGIQGKGYEVSNYVAGLMHGVWYMKIGLQPGAGKDADPVQVRKLLFQHYVDPDNGTRYFAKDQFDALGRFATVQDRTEGTPGVTMSDLIARMDAGASPAAKPRKKAAKAK